MLDLTIAPDTSRTRTRDLCVQRGIGSRRCAPHTKPVQWVEAFVEHLCSRSEVRAVGVIGMCQSGAFPIATMKQGSKVKGVVLSQPALPFPHDHQRNVGLTDATMQQAKDSGVPILAFRFKEDTISTCDRFEYLLKFFGTSQMEGHQIDGPPGYHQTLTHRLHAVLTGPFGDIREGARQKVIEFLNRSLS